ncbi:RNA polymerase I-specific transcription initiation factor RRN3-like isoform X1 [Anneissia japonica]|uniref:RNA polymerase I-specific transcription initiation factor RRN3-like isoform X1 n=1 Tax=Anneissia japonica TaxID=1529436 RepID=UPI0014258452|nr:RNA polymerase I-specific transcription initiation factor RRN3-like isoform X1 [Anneissia japonica]XP_033121713.1 RNA polymerase I-specific transcription initiation factor RRN3-like isoform X2 [Anneissia japonica]XP_033121714.1 RNA polymerase I-specific transcription initiation factor RRN3-like isoform X1 [Anneissia japonica]
MHGKEAGMSSKSVRFGGKVAEILTQYKEGNTKGYDLLIHQLADPEIKSCSLLSWIQELRQAVTLLYKDFESLVSTVLKVRWEQHDPEVIDEYRALLVDLVSAQTLYLRLVLKMLIKKFLLNYKPMDETDEAKMKRMASESACFRHVHTTLQIIIKIVPMTPQFLMPALSDCFPFMRKDVYVQECYVKNLLVLTQYVPRLRQKILELIIEKLILLDVHAPRAEIEEAEDAEDSEDDMEDVMFEMDGVSEEVIEDKCNLREEEEEETTDSKKTIRPMKHPLANTLDVLMKIMLEYIHDTCHPNDEFNIDCTKDLYRNLLSIFEIVVLPTHACCHVQFFMFFICSFRQGLSDLFLDYLWKKIENPNTSQIVRQAAASYVASFLSRAKFVPIAAVRTGLDVMISWVHRYIDCQDGSTRSYADVNLHGTFYSVCQAIFYTFVFRHKNIIESEKGLLYARSLNLERIVTCRLNPLKVCLPTVVNMFATITRIHEIAFCYTVIERNNRAIIPVVTQTQCGTSTQLTNMNPLDSFFPFDPYILHMSATLIEPLYQLWEGQQVEDQQSSSEDEDNKEEECYSLYADKESLLPLGITPTAAMCVSPGFRSASFGT